MRTEVTLVDLEHPPREVTTGAEVLRALIRLRQRPLGWLEIPTTGGLVTGEELLRTSAAWLGGLAATAVFRRLLGHLSVEAAPATPAPITVVVCSRDRPARLEGCLRALQKLEYPAFEVLVVDNASRNGETQRIAAALGAGCVREPVPGLDRARNHGIAAAAHDIIAFTDDDARPDPLWLKALAAGFRDPEVMAVTGLIAPASLETPAQRLFELKYGGMVQSLDRRRIHREAVSRWGLLWTSAFGAGANMAFRREIFERIGGFDPSLDVGTPAGGGGDLEILHRLLAAGYTLLYEPAAIVWHQHRSELPALRRQLFDNGRGFGAYLLTCARNRTVSPLTVGNFFLGSWLAGWVLKRLIRPRGFPRQLILIELIGSLLSPFFYFAARRGHGQD